MHQHQSRDSLVASSGCRCKRYAKTGTDQDNVLLIDPRLFAHPIKDQRHRRHRIAERLPHQRNGFQDRASAFNFLGAIIGIFDADDGAILWETVLGGAVQMSTITYSVDGRQYVAVYTGEGLMTSGLMSWAEISPPRGHNSVYVFALPR